MQVKLKILLVIVSAIGFFPSYATTSFEMQILEKINQYRHHKGLANLQYNKVIAAEAVEHSRDMAEHKIAFGHQFFSERIATIFQALKNCQAGAENVAYNYKNADILVQEWIKSPGHRQNIVGNYNLTGIGIARDAAGKAYYTQLFIRKPG